MTFISYAQNYEDLRLWRALGHIMHGFYLDVGAQHPVMDSVSKAFYDAGWRGAHVEPSPSYASALRESRPDEKVFETAIGEQNDPIIFYEIPETGMSTGVAEIARQHNDSGFAVRLREVPVVPLSKIFAELGETTIHWMKIDVEGMERDVIASWGDSAAKPWVLVIESVHPASHDPTEGDWINLILDRGYHEVAFDGLSRFFVADEHRDIAASLAFPPHIFDDFRVTKYHFSSQLVAAEYIAELELIRGELATKKSEIDALSDNQAQQLQAVHAALAEEQAKSAANEAETVRLGAELANAEARAAETLVARNQIAEMLRTTESLLAGQRNELALAGATIAQLETSTRALENKLESTVADHESERELAGATIARLEIATRTLAVELERTVTDHDEASARAQALHRALLSDFAQLERSHLELQQQLADLQMSKQVVDEREADKLDARIVALESQIDVLTQQVADNRAGNLTSDCEAVEATIQEAGGPAESVGDGLPVRIESELAPMTLDDLLSLHDEQFVTRAYRLLLNREADPEGLRHYTKLLRRGGGRIRILSDLARSKEGRKVDAQIPGLSEAMRSQRVRDLLSLRPITSRLFGNHLEDDVIARLRAIENGLARLDGHGPVARQPSPSALAPLSVDPVQLPPAPSPAVDAAPSPIVTLDADRMLAVEEWPAVAKSMFERHWPAHRSRLKDVKVDSARQLWLIVAGDDGLPVPPQTVASLRALRDAASFDIEFGSLGPSFARGATKFKSLEDVATTVSPDSLVMFIGTEDQLDERLPTALLLEDAWSRDFILTDQIYAEGGRLALVPFHGIDHYHLSHVDYFWSRFVVSGRALRDAVKGGAIGPLSVSRAVLSNLRDKPGRRLHLQFPFLRNGSLDLKTVRERRHTVMRDLAGNAPATKAAWNNSVSVVICTKDGGYLLDGLVHQLLDLPQVAEILIVSNNSSGDYTLDLLDRLARNERCKVFRYDKPFNFSIQCNIAVSAAKGDFLLLLNDDVSLIGSDWLNCLLNDVDGDRERIAGPLMLYATQSIQHGGMYLGHNDRAGHTFRHQRHPHDAPMFELVAPRQVTCLTGACLLLRRSLYERMNGLDEQLATGFQDVDFALRALCSGVELVFDPRAIIFHLESVSINPSLADEAVLRRRDREYKRFKARWGSELLPDPWHNRNFYIEDESLRSVRIAD